MPRLEDGALTLPVVVGDINEAETGPISFLGQEFPTEDEWSATIHVDVDLDSHWQHVGLMQVLVHAQQQWAAFLRVPDRNQWFAGLARQQPHS